MLKALAPGGTIAIAEWLVNGTRTGPADATSAVDMLVNLEEGDTYSFGEISSWLTEAGFSNAHTNAQTVEVPGSSPLMLSTKP